MEIVGENIERIQNLVHIPMSPHTPGDIRQWQLEAEHLLHLAHQAKDAGDIDRLRELDKEAVELIRSREEFGQMN